jgi:DNA repair protein RadC
MNTAFNLSYIAEVELVYSTKVKPSNRIKISSSKGAYEILNQTWNENTIELREEMKVILLNNWHKVLGIYNVSHGGITGTVADPKLIFAAALKANATGIILAHNHPSGNSQPSQADIGLTRKCKEIGELLDIKILDHMIMTTEGYYSFADEGMM